jgi:hypothetical protein
MINPLEVKAEYENQISSLEHYLKAKGITLTKEYNGQPYVGSSFINGKEGVYFKIKQRSFLSESQTETIKNSFPLKITDGKDLYSWDLLSISDYDWDDDRYWEPSVSVRLIKNGKSVF